MSQLKLMPNDVFLRGDGTLNNRARADSVSLLYSYLSPFHLYALLKVAVDIIHVCE